MKSDQTKQFILNHLHADVHHLALQAKRYPDVDMVFAVRQISGRQKIRYKVPSFYENDEILYPQSLSIEQSSSEITAQYKASLCNLKPNRFQKPVRFKNIVDLTGGFGIDCFFISRNFEKAFYVEKQTALCEIAQHNFNVLQAHNITIVNDEAENHLSQMQTVDCIFIDPARRSGSGKKLVFLADCEPNVQMLAPQLLEKAETVLIKLSPMLDISKAVNEIPQTAEIHILAVENECKEILLVLRKEKTDDTLIKCVNFLKDNSAQTFEYKLAQEAEAPVTYASELKKYLYEPNASIMKAGGFRSICEHYNIEKLHPSTHLYTSDEWIPDFAGRRFEIVGTYSEKELKKRASNIQKANISVRNYPVGAEELRKKLKIQDGGDCYLFACTLMSNEKVIVECKPLQTSPKGRLK